SQLSQSGYAARRHLSRLHGASPRRVEGRLSFTHSVVAAGSDQRTLCGVPRRWSPRRDSRRGGKGMNPSARIPSKDAIIAVHRARAASDIVITTMSPARDWMTLPQQPLDIVFVPSAMGHATSVGLGLALDQPHRRVIVCNGDGSMLMNLGSLVSIAGAGATNLVVLVFDNGVYEVTGSQPTPGLGQVDFAAIARGSGFSSVFEFSDVESWRANVANVLAAPGPVFVTLRVVAEYGIPGPRSPGPAGDRARRLLEEVSVAPR